MSTRCHVATRKGLFTVERGAKGWAIRARISAKKSRWGADPRSGRLLAALTTAMSDEDARSRMAAPRGRRSEYRSTGETADYVRKRRLRKHACGLVVSSSGALAGGADQRASSGAARCGRIVRSRDEGDSGRTARCGTTAQRGRLAAAAISGHSLVCASRDSRTSRGGVCGGVGARAMRTDLGHRGHGTTRRVHAARAPIRSERAGSASRRAVPRESRCPLDSAPQRHFQIDRWRSHLERDQGREAVDVRVSRCCAPARSEYGVVRPVKDAKRYRPGVRGRDRTRTAADVRHADARPAAGTRLRSGVSPRARHRRERRSSRVRFDDGFGVAERERRRFVANDFDESAAGVCAEV